MPSILEGFSLNSLFNSVYLTLYWLVAVAVPFLAVWGLYVAMKYRLLIIELVSRAGSAKIKFRFAKKVKNKDGVMCYKTAGNMQYKPTKNFNTVFSAGFFDVVFTYRLNNTDVRPITISEELSMIEPVDEDTIQWMMTALAENERDYKIRDIMEKYGPFIVQVSMVGLIIVVMIFTYKYGERVVDMINFAISTWSKVQGPGVLPPA